MRRWVFLGFGCAVLAFAAANLIVWLGGREPVTSDGRVVVGGLITESISSVGT